MNASSHLGTCRLCQLPNMELKDSHFVSKGVFRLLRSPGKTNPHPMHITAGRSFQSSKQPTKHLLCASCEGLLDKNGENWVLSQALRADGSFKLASSLQARAPIAQDAQTQFYLSASIPEINVPAIAHFAAGIFWRGSIHAWNDDGTVPIRLGPYGEQFRQYLLGKAEFPSNAVLLVYARKEGLVSRLAAAPWGGREGPLHTYRFVLPGLAFVLHVASCLPQALREHCFVRGPKSLIAFTSVVEARLLTEARTLLQAPRPTRKRTH